jgi:hypothetical protein
LVGSIRPGERVSVGSPFFLVTWVAVVDRLTVGGARVDERHDGRVVQEDDSDVSAGLAAVLVVDRVDLARVVVRAAGRDHGGGQLADRLVGGDHAVVGGACAGLSVANAEDKAEIASSGKPPAAPVTPHRACARIPDGRRTPISTRTAHWTTSASSPEMGNWPRRFQAHCDLKGFHRSAIRD